MRALLGLTAAALMSAAAMAVADPVDAPEYAMEVVHRPDAIFAGLARDGEALLVTNLADGRLYRREADGRLVAFGPALPYGADVMGDPTGPYRIARFGAGYLVAQGWTPANNAEVAYDHALLEIRDSGEVRVISNDFWNPYAFTVADNTIAITLDPTNVTAWNNRGHAYGIRGQYHQAFADFNEALKVADIARRFRDNGCEPLGTTPAETAAFVRNEAERWGRVIKTAGIKLE